MVDKYRHWVPDWLLRYELEHGDDRRTLRFASLVRPFSSWVALPVFAFFSAGVAIPWGGAGGNVFLQPVVYAVVLGLVVGKPLGVMMMTQ